MADEPKETKRRFKPRAPTVRPKQQEAAAADDVEADEPRGRGRGKGGKGAGRLKRNDGKGKGQPQGVAFFETSAVKSTSSGDPLGLSKLKSEAARGGGAGKRGFDEDVACMMEDDSDDEKDQDDDDMDVATADDDPLAPVRIGGLAGEAADLLTNKRGGTAAPMTFDEEVFKEVRQMLDQPLLSKLAEDEFVVVQLPTKLPPCLPREEVATAMKDEEDDAELSCTPTNLQPTNLHAQPLDVSAQPPYDDISKLERTPGVPLLLGTLELLKSGKARLRIGDEVFDVERGLPTNMLQQVATVDYTAKMTMSILGRVAEKILVTNSCDDNYDPDWAAKLY